MVVDRKGIIGFLVAVCCCAGCQAQPDDTAPAPTARITSATAASSVTGPVAETMDAGGYTYVRVEAGGKSVWAAGPEQVIEPGTQVTLALDMPMPGFRSDTLDRTFDVLYFVRGFGADSGPAHTRPEPIRDGLEVRTADQSIADLYARRDDLAGQAVRVRGEVVKATNAILGTNWIHIQDGSGGASTHDLTVTTDATVPVGAVVLVEGVLSLDRDFGAGYSYDLMIESATVTVE